MCIIKYFITALYTTTITNKAVAKIASPNVELLRTRTTSSTATWRFLRHILNRKNFISVRPGNTIFR